MTLPGGPDEPGDGTGEVALDIEVIRGIAPHAQITNYEGANTLPTGSSPIIARIVADGTAKIISNSWGTCENRNNRQAMAAEEHELAAAFAAGISYFTASGDDAAFDCRRVTVSRTIHSSATSRPGVDWPAASTNVIAVGGTFLTMREDGTYYDEAGWEEPLGGSGTGGGLSRFQPRPSWQQGAGVDNAQSNGKRQVPDVAGPADPSSGFFVIYTDPDRGRVSDQVGGTSAAAPFWAASMLLTQQFAASTGCRAARAARTGAVRRSPLSSPRRRVPRRDQGRQPALPGRPRLGLRNGPRARRASRRSRRRSSTS